MAHLRFTTARELFEAFPTARDDIGAEPTDEGPWAFLKTLLASPTPEDAIAFCAYLLPRREAVWWACQCVRVLAPPRDEAEQAALDTAETWVREPEESRRRPSNSMPRPGGLDVAPCFRRPSLSIASAVGRHGAHSQRSRNSARRTPP